MRDKSACVGYSFTLHNDIVTFIRLYQTYHFMMGIRMSCEQVCRYGGKISRKNFNNLVFAILNDRGLSWGCGKTKIYPSGEIKLVYLKLHLIDECLNNDFYDNYGMGRK